MNRRTDDKTAAERFAFASMWIGFIAFGLSFWMFVGPKLLEIMEWIYA